MNPTITTEAPATLPTPRRARLTDLTPHLLVPGSPALPKAVRDAAAKARDAWATYELAALDHAEAEQDAAEAPALDQQADAAALERGEDLPEPTAPATRRAVAEANRRKQAAEQNLRQALREQAEQLRDHFGEAVEAQQQRVEKRIAAISGMVEKLRAEFAALDADRTMLDALGFFGDGGGNPDDWRFQAARPDRDQRRRELAEAEDATSRTLRPRADIPLADPTGCWLRSGRSLRRRHDDQRQRPAPPRGSGPPAALVGTGAGDESQGIVELPGGSRSRLRLVAVKPDAFAGLLSRLDPRPGVRGRQFERICAWYLRSAPEYRRRFRKVWLWSDWPGAWAATPGSTSSPRNTTAASGRSRRRSYDPRLRDQEGRR